MKAQKLNGKRNSLLWIKIFLTTLTLLLISCQSIPVVFAATPTANVSPQDDLPPTQSPDTLAPTVTQHIYLPTVSNRDSTKRYYFDSVNGSDSNSGTSPSSPWQSLAKLNNTNYNPGEQIFLKRGSFWSGEWLIDNSGTAAKPILFSSYGDSGDLPTFSNTGTGLVSSIRIKSDYVILERVKTIDARLTGVYLITGADHNIVRYIESTNTGAGVKVNGQYNLITRNYIHDLFMVVNTNNNGNDDYGATGIWLFNHYNEVSYNQIINCRAPSYDYGEDGGAVEFFLDVNGSYVHHNYAYNTKGFMEIGGGTAYDNIIAYNVIVNSGRALGLHLHNGDQNEIQRLYFYNNTVVDTTAEGFNATILFLGAPPNPTMLYMRNNVFYLKNYNKVASNVTPGTDFTHTNNIYYLENGSQPGFTLTASETRANPNFVDVMGGDFTLSSSSPAINTGVNLGYTIDFNGLPVPVGGSPDMGSHEFQTVQ